jgi:hypothetical protein
MRGNAGARLTRGATISPTPSREDGGETVVGNVGTVEGTSMRELRAIAILVLICACLLMGVPLLTSL